MLCLEFGVCKSHMGSGWRHGVRRLESLVAVFGLEHDFPLATVMMTTEIQLG